LSPDSLQPGVLRVLDVELRAPPQLGRRGDLIVGQIGQMHLADHLRGGLSLTGGAAQTPSPEALMSVAVI
jgi:hypothetical protein